jgi:rhamnosyltransferase
MISVIINFNEPNEFFIRENLNNILNQTYKNFEVLANINFDKEEFIQILENNNINPEKISVFQEKNINCIIDNLKSDYFIFKKNEHKWMPNKLKIMKEEFEKHTEEDLEMVYSDCFLCDELENILKETPQLMFKKKPIYLIKKMKDNSFSLNNMFNINSKKIEQKLYLNQVV